MARHSSEQNLMLKPEEVAYWYFRLNGFFQIENFVVHPPGGGAQRTDADLLAVRFPFRSERLIDHPSDIMRDDTSAIGLDDSQIDVLIVEIKTSQCALNGPWTDETKENVHRVLAAIGCIPPALIPDAARAIYREGVHRGERGIRVRLVAVGRDRSDELLAQYPSVRQLVWSEMLGFVWGRFRAYRRQKTQVDQWNASGKRLKQLADRQGRDEFVAQVLQALHG
jgi:hypothetical protein